MRNMFVFVLPALIAAWGIIHDTSKGRYGRTLLLIVFTFALFFGHLPKLFKLRDIRHEGRAQIYYGTLLFIFILLLVVPFQLRGCRTEDAEVRLLIVTVFIIMFPAAIFLMVIDNVLECSFDLSSEADSDADADSDYGSDAASDTDTGEARYVVMNSIQ